MANYAHVENGQITGVYDLLPINWQNVSNLQALSEDKDALQSLGWVEITKIETSYNEYTQRLGNPIHNIVDGQVVETMEVINLPPYEPIQPIIITELDIAADNIRRHNEAMQYLRDKRDRLLSASDFTQLPDVINLNGTELNKLIQDYRQELRDLPNQYINDLTFFDASFVEFPKLPTSVPVTQTETPSDNGPV